VHLMRWPSRGIGRWVAAGVLAGGVALGLVFALHIGGVGGAANFAAVVALAPLIVGLIKWARSKPKFHDDARNQQVAFGQVLQALADGCGLTRQELCAGVQGWDSQNIESYLSGDQVPGWDSVAAFLDVVARDDRWQREALVRQVKPQWEALDRASRTNAWASETTAQHSTRTEPVPDAGQADQTVRASPDPRRGAVTAAVVGLLVTVIGLAVALALVPGVPSAAKPTLTGSGALATRPWTFTTASSVDASPAIADGVVYVGDDSGEFFALSAATGRVRWERMIGGAIFSTAAVANGTVFFGDDNRNVYALNAETGAARWTTLTSGGVDSSPAVAGGSVYVGNGFNDIYALNAATGAVRWIRPTDNDVNSSPVIYHGTLYVGSDDDNVYALNPLTGGVRWTRLTGGAVNSSPAVSDGTVYVGSDDGKVYALNAGTGAIEWTTPTGGAVDSSPAVSDGTVYIGSDNGKVYALNAGTGAVRWARLTGGAVKSSPAVSGGTVYVGSDDGKVYALDAATGAIEWASQTGGAVNSSPAVSDRTIYIGSDNDEVCALRAP
jgi:outer membrane protein assembly factor BamB